MIDKYFDELNRLTDVHARNLEVAESLESIVNKYDFESFESVDYQMLNHLLETTISSRGFPLDVLSMEDDSPAPASDAAIGKDQPSKTDRLKEGIKKAAATFAEKAKHAATDIVEYLKKLEQVLTNSTQALKNSVTAIENKLQNNEPGNSKIQGKFSIFAKSKPAALLGLVSDSATVLSRNIEPVFNDYVKKAKGGETTGNVNLSLKDHTGAEYKYDGTTKFFKPNMSFESLEMSSLTKADIEATCREVTKLVVALDEISSKSKRMASTNFDSLVSTTKDGSSTVKSSVKEVMSISSFNRNVIGGYVKYAIKIAQTSLDACNKSINKPEGKTNE